MHCCNLKTQTVFFCRGDSQQCSSAGARLTTPEVPQRRDRPLQETSHNHNHASSNKENHVTCQVTPNDQCVRELLKEGHERSAVERALSIANNNLSMARNILVNFVPKS